MSYEEIKIISILIKNFKLFYLIFIIFFFGERIFFIVIIWYCLCFRFFIDFRSCLRLLVFIFCFNSFCIFREGYLGLNISKYNVRFFFFLILIIVRL